MVSMEHHSKLSKRITLYLEGFTHIVPVPMAVYFTMAVGAFKSEKEAIGILISGFISGVVMMSLGTMCRYFVIQKLFSEYLVSESKDRIKKLKIGLLNLPYFEAKIIFARWFMGVPFAHMVYILGWGVEKDLHISIPFVMMFTAPISYIAHLFISERIIEFYLKQNEFRRVEINLNSKEIKKLNYFLRIIFSLFSIISMPFILLGYFLYASYAGFVHLGNPILHIGILGLSTFIPLFITALYLASAMKRGLTDVEQTISELAKGNFKRFLPILSTNEFASQASHINSVINALKKMYIQLKDLNENLEKKVSDRTNELQESLINIKELKFKQDGDYFLTALLLKPFTNTKVKTDYLKIEYSVKQKKEFEFNGRYYEIGGDLCFSDFITLHGKEFVLIVNADAMGKSIQGAGGILVLGAVLKSAIERNSILNLGEDLYPEIWLKNLYKELHRVFISFEGSMLISLVLGLIEKETGLYYYINAEHPWSVLYRDNKASFLETNILIHKLGFELETREASVNVFELDLNDSIIIGSDGKDDIMFMEENKKSVNEDETLFLRTLESVKGEIKEFHKIILEQGEIIDDVSLLKFTYLKEKKYNLEMNSEYYSKSISELKEIFINRPEEISIGSYLSEKFFDRKEYLEVVEILKPILEKYPSSTENIFLISRAYYNLKDLENAIFYSELVRAREPYLIKNLIFQSEVFIEMKDFKKALKRIEDGLKKDKKSQELILRKQTILGRMN